MGAEPPVGYLLGGLLLGFLGGGLSMRAWDAMAVGRAMLGTQWEAEASLAMRATMALPAWAWTLVLFGCAAVVSFAWMAEAKKHRIGAVVAASVVSVLAMAVLAAGLYQPVRFSGAADGPSQEAIDAAEPIEE